MSEPLRLKAYAASGAAWSFYVKDEASGLKLPVVQDSYSIVIDGHQHYAVLALECQIFAHPAGDDYLKLGIDASHLVAEQGFVKLLDPPRVWRHSSVGEVIECKVMLDGFGKEELE